MKENSRNKGITNVEVHDPARPQSNTGITLVALVITIIIMLILAGVAISMLFGENGLIKRAQEATSKWNEAQQNELDALNQIENEMGGYTNGGNISLPDIPEIKENEVVSRRRFFSKRRSNRNSMVRLRK